MTKNSALDPSADSPSRVPDSKGLEKHAQERYIKLSGSCEKRQITHDEMTKRQKQTQTWIHTGGHANEVVVGYWVIKQKDKDRSGKQMQI